MDLVYRVFLTEPAKQDIKEYAQYILEESKSTEVAKNWIDGLYEAIQVLTELPQRFPLIQEAELLNTPYRSFHYHSHRVIYRVDSSRVVVYIVRIYHGARKSLTPKDVR